jgi:NAD(P)-dependent dehydrogenase (short-subunit alcohol dehydrogenase family)
MASVRELAARLRAGDPLHAVVHNAGVMLHERTETDEGNEATLATHVLGPHLLSRLLSPTPARTIWVSSGGMYAQKLDLSDPQFTQDYNGTTAYAKTKRMQVVLAQEWAQRLRGEGVVHAMHPGWVATPGLTDGLATFARLTKPILRPPAQGADTIVWLAAADEPAASTGRFWQDRRPRPTHYLSKTRESTEDRARLWDLCERLTAD